MLVFGTFGTLIEKHQNIPKPHPNLAAAACEADWKVIQTAQEAGEHSPKEGAEEQVTHSFAGLLGFQYLVKSELLRGFFYWFNMIL